MKIKNLIAHIGILSSMLLMIPVFSSFKSLRGGEGFEVFLNNKVVAQHFGKELTRQASLQLDPAMEKLELKVIYHHCGQNGKNRQLTIRNEAKQVIHTWKFADSKSAASPMIVRIDELSEYKKAGKALRWTLHYTSSELPAGRELAVLEKNNSLAVRK